MTSFKRQKWPKFVIKQGQSSKNVQTIKIQVRLELLIQFKNKNYKKNFGVKFSKFGQFEGQISKVLLGTR